MHALVVSPEGVLAEHGPLRLVVQLEMDPVHREVPATFLRALYELSPKSRPGALWWDGLGLEDPQIVADPRHGPAALEQVVQPPVPVNVVVGQVELGYPGVAHREAVLSAVPLDQLPLDHPVDLPLHETQIAGLDRLEPAFPQVEGAIDQWRSQLAPVHEVAGPGEVLVLDLQGAGLAAVGEAHLPASGHVVGDLADRADRVLHRQVAHHHTFFDHPQHQVAAGDLEHGGRLAHVRVADDDVQPPVALRIGVRLVAGVDDRPAPGGGAGDPLPDVLGALADREHRASWRLGDLPGPADDLPGHQERDEYVGQLRELAVPSDEVVLVAAVGVAGGVGVVLEQVHVAGDPLVVQSPFRVDQQPFEDALSRLVMGDQVADVVALGGGVLRVATDVEVEPGPVAEEDVAAAAPGHHLAKQVARNLVRREASLPAERAGDAVLVLDPEYPAVHVPTLSGSANPAQPTRWFGRRSPGGSRRYGGGRRATMDDTPDVAQQQVEGDRLKRLEPTDLHQFPSAPGPIGSAGSLCRRA